jgi:hypothetical protein
MKISKIHQDFAINLRVFLSVSKQDVLDHPENFLGPNWEAVINFWLYLDTLNKKQLKVVKERYLDLSYRESLIDAANTTTHASYYAGDSAYYSVFPNAVVHAKYATLELIGLEKLLVQGHQPLFFPLFLNL